MTSLRYILLSCVLILSGSFSALAFATCNTESPHAKETESIFEPLKPAPISRAQYKVLQKLVSKQRGRNWRGRYTQMQCVGPEDQPRELSKHYSADVTIDLSSNGDLVISIQAENKQEALTDQVIIETNETATTTDDINNTNIRVISVSKNKLEVHQKINLRNVGGGARPIEYLYTLSNASSKQLTLQRQTFIHGKLTGADEWQLKRR